MRRLLSNSMALMFAATAAHAVQIETGDVLVSIGNGRVAHLDGDTLSVVQTLDSGIGGFTTGSAFDAAGNFYVTNFSNSLVSKFDKNGALVNSNFATCDAGAACESIVFDKAGNFYVGQADGTRDVLKFDGDGTLIDRFDVQVSARGSDWIDLAADQTTLFYTSENFEVFTYDLENDTQGALFATLADRPAFALRLLATGGLLVSDSVNIKRLDASGNTIQTYDTGFNDSWFSLNIDGNGKSFYAGDFSTNVLAEFDIASGDLIRSVDLGTLGLGSVNFFGVSVFGERTVGNPNPNPVPLPAAGWLLFAGIGALVAYRRRAA